MKHRVMAAVAMLLLVLPPAERAASDQQEIVDSAYLVADHIRAGSGAATNARELLHRARAILIIPELVKGGFILGGQGGSGVLLARNADNTWSYPAFYTMGSGSIGLQAGIAVSKIVLIIMSDKALQAVMRDEFKIGAEAGIAIATIGAGAEAATTANGWSDIYAFAESKGLFGGIAIEGGVMKPRPSYIQAYYGSGATLADVIVRRNVSNAGAEPLRGTLNQISAAR